MLFFGTVLSLLVLMSATKATQMTVDLTGKGIPVTINAPDGSEIFEGVGNGLDFEGVVSHVWEVTKHDEDFSIEVAMEDGEMWQNAADYVADWREIYEMDEAFVEFVVSDEHGFICKYDLEGEMEFDFYYQLVKGDRAIEFSMGLGSDNYSLENVRKHYEVAKAAK